MKNQHDIKVQIIETLEKNDYTFDGAELLITGRLGELSAAYNAESKYVIISHRSNVRHLFHSNKIDPVAVTKLLSDVITNNFVKNGIVDFAFVLLEDVETHEVTVKTTIKELSCEIIDKKLKASIPFKLKNEFKKAFKSAKWDAENSLWQVPAKQESELKDWLESKRASQ